MPGPAGVYVSNIAYMRQKQKAWEGRLQVKTAAGETKIKYNIVVIAG
jgi:hypothetical protein